MNETTAARMQRGHVGACTAGRLTQSTRRQRLSALEVLTLLAVAVLLIVGAVSARPRISTGAQGQTVQVQAGETLWSLAQAHPIAGLTTAQATAQISRSNQLTSSSLRAGQTLVVPAGTQSTPQMASR